MERIAWRAVVAVAILGVLLGIPAMYFGFNGHKSMQELSLAESKLADISRESCNTKANGDNVEESICWQTWSAETLSNSWMMEQSSESMDLFLTGVTLALVLPALLFPIFFTLRWIFTGRWLRKLPD